MHTPPCARGRPPAQGKARQQRASSRGPLEHFFLPPQDGSGKKRRWQKARPRRICRVAAAMICGCSRSLFRCACGSFRCQKRLPCSRRHTTTVLKSRSGRAAMEGRPIVRRWRRLQRGPFVVYRGPSRPASDYTHSTKAFNPARTAFVVLEESPFHGQVKP